MSKTQAERMLQAAQLVEQLAAPPAESDTGRLDRYPIAHIPSLVLK